MSENWLELVKKWESEEIELKKSTAQLERALKSVCGFLNHKGGRAYFGINKGIIVGQAVSDQTLKSISQKIRQRIKYVKEKGSISNKEYCNLLTVSRKTATTDLIDLVDKAIFSPFGTSKRVLRYEFILRKKYAKRGVK